MSRRLIASLSVLVVSLLAVAAIALSGGGGGSSAATAATAAATMPAPATAPATYAGGPRGFMRGAHGRAMFRFLGGLVLKSAADRLGVTPAKLKAAAKTVAEAQFAKKAAEAKLTPEETAALKACRRAFRGVRHAGAAGPGAAGAGACDRTTAKAAIAKLKALPKPDLAALKTELSDALGAELGVPGAKVVEAARAELSDRLDQGVKLGIVTADGKAKALACFDAPNACDMKALHRALRPGHPRAGAFRHFRRQHRFGAPARRQ
ncbi:hypothetical protein NBH00_02765 [Paraconexibacter antarcticus]|uniref:Uncharacterized protein n=1 Tax=Paraconexibacter antarcticus TaxID=2949664 RepID=A0ABY5DWT6_9ACTN|nr:hypothetical protein [Paraconexibacter antarcticus]UTI65142.1 hypothetical protein NBH00_02765 [Paraconexibacter antarcticus]